MGALRPPLLLLSSDLLFIHESIVVAKFLEACRLVHLVPEGDFFILVELVDKLLGTVLDWTLTVAVCFEALIALFCRFFKTCQVFLSERLHLF